MEREVRLPKVPKRIVSLVPSQTELLVDLGLESLLVGITKFCVHPKNLCDEKPIMGGTKKVHFDKIRAQNPDIILCNKEENTKEMVLELEKIAPVHVSDVEVLSDVFVLIQQYGSLFQVSEKAAEIINIIKNKATDLQEFISNKPSKRVAYLIWKKPWMAVGKDTFIDYLLDFNRFTNVFVNEDSRYPNIDLESIPVKETELVLLSTEPFPFQEKHAKKLRQKFKNMEVEIVDGEFFSWYGSRLIKAFDYFKRLHP